MKFNHIHHEFPKLIRDDSSSSRLYLDEEQNKYPSVTTVLSSMPNPSLQEWKNRVGEKEAERISKVATTRGSAVHDALERHLKNEELDLQAMMPNVKQLFVNIRNVLNEKVNNIHCLETQMFSKTLRMAGTVDCIAEYDGKLSVIDFKTSRRLKRKDDISSYFAQGCAYSVMFEELTEQRYKIEQVVILIGVDNKTFAQVMIEKPLYKADYLLDCMRLWKANNDLI